MITKIGLIGYGKMGKMIDNLAPDYNVAVIWNVTRGNIDQLTPEKIKSADVIIEMTTPESALKNVLLGLRQGVPVVCGTTGWIEHIEEAKAAAAQHNTGFLYASNFSVGVNLFFKLNQHLAKIMEPYTTDYEVCLQEIHHTEKKDAPSGTAITLAQDILAHNPQKKVWKLFPTEYDEELSIEAVREDQVPGTHTVIYRGHQDEITITHRAFSREGFAVGALLAAKFMVGKTGFHGMSDVL